MSSFKPVPSCIVNKKDLIEYLNRIPEENVKIGDHFFPDTGTHELVLEVEGDFVELRKISEINKNHENFKGVMPEPISAFN